MRVGSAGGGAKGGAGPPKRRRPVREPPTPVVEPVERSGDPRSSQHRLKTLPKRTAAVQARAELR